MDTRFRHSKVWILPVHTYKLGIIFYVVLFNCTFNLCYLVLMMSRLIKGERKSRSHSNLENFSFFLLFFESWVKNNRFTVIKLCHRIQGEDVIVNAEKCKKSAVGRLSLTHSVTWRKVKKPHTHKIHLQLRNSAVKRRKKSFQVQCLVRNSFFIIHYSQYDSLIDACLEYANKM